MMLQWLEIPFEVMVSQVDEKVVQEKDPQRLVEKLARMKAEAVVDEIEGGEQVVVLGSDTVIYVQNEEFKDLGILGKPEDEQEARRMLKSMRGINHDIWTGVCMIDLPESKVEVVSVKSVIKIREFEDRELDEYMRTDEWRGKAGAYQIVGEVRKLVEKIEGSVTNIAGLPLVEVVEMLRSRGMEIEVNEKQVIKERTGFGS